MREDSKPLLGKAQTQLEASARVLKLAQKNFIKAQLALSDAEDKHKNDTLDFLNVVNTVRASTKVTPIGL